MKSTPEAHRSHPWKVHALAPDFEVIDVWRFELQGVEGGFDRFLNLFWGQLQVVEQQALSRLRVAIGKVVGWDKQPHSLPIPGCKETSIAERLSADERDRASAQVRPLKSASMRPIYRLENEALYEASNDTVHALLHLGFSGGNAELAVYIKSRGPFTRFYMAAIWPFRHLIIYPRMIASVEGAWRRAATLDLGSEASTVPLSPR